MVNLFLLNICFVLILAHDPPPCSNQSIDSLQFHRKTMIGMERAQKTQLAPAHKILTFPRPVLLDS